MNSREALVRLHQPLWLVNARAGSGAGTALLSALRGRGCAAEGIDFETLESTLKTLSKDQMVVVAGGDGTVSSVLAMVARLELPISVAVFPLGTGNDLARSLGVGRHVPLSRLDEYLRGLAQSSSKNLQLWCLSWGDSERIFCNYFSMGFDGHVLAGFERWRARTPHVSRVANRIAYVYQACKAANKFLLLTDLHLVRDGISLPLRRGRARSILFTNISNLIGFATISPLCSPFDAQLECVRFDSLSNYVGILLPSAWSSIRPPLVGKGSTWSISGLTGDVYAQVDGEGLIISGADSLEIRPYKSVSVVAFNAEERG